MSDSISDATSRMVDALNDPDRLYDRIQLAYFMGASARWAREVAMAECEPDPLSWRAGFDAGYRARVDEENAAYPPAPYRIAAGLVIADARAAARATPYIGTYRGGPVEDWGPSAPDHVPDLRVSTRVAHVDGRLIWVDA